MKSSVLSAAMLLTGSLPGVALAFDDMSCAKVVPTTQKVVVDIRHGETTDAARARSLDEVSKLAVFEVIGGDVESARSDDIRSDNDAVTSHFRDVARSSYRGLVRVKLIDSSLSGFDDHQQLNVTADVSVCLPKPETVVTLEKEKAARDRVPPRVVDPDKAVWFDPTTGEPQLWYWSGPNDTYTFFDKNGFDPTTGDPLKQADREFAKSWRLAAIKRQKDAAVAAAAEQKELARQEAEATAARQKAEARATQMAQALQACDAEAANPNDPRKPSSVAGIKWDDLKIGAERAVKDCEMAVQQQPTEPRFRYQLARAYSTYDPKRSLAIFKKLCDERYPAAYDNYGWALLDRRVGLNDLSGAVHAFDQGIRAGDSDAMTSMASLMIRERVNQNFPGEPMQLFKRAAQLGNADAVSALAKLEADEAQANAQRVLQDEQARQDAVQQEQARRMFMGIMGGALANVGRR